ncbi:MAG: hypothetical protein B7X92_10355 [Novosphingobium sp. 17-62-9]|nr:MAG: hypothetical protein B7Z36_02350 [Novosphingobium sp. 12-63-9]OZA34376.1 MAG: hypothetical protein B7X92_10355 [Novosphingobium sp. 17-62-9]
MTTDTDRERALVEAAMAMLPRNLNLADWLPDDAQIPLDVPVSELRALQSALSQYQEPSK